MISLDLNAVCSWNAAIIICSQMHHCFPSCSPVKPLGQAIGPSSTGPARCPHSDLLGNKVGGMIASTHTRCQPMIPTVTRHPGISSITCLFHPPRRTLSPIRSIILEVWRWASCVLWQVLQWGWNGWPVACCQAHDNAMDNGEAAMSRRCL